MFNILLVLGDASYVSAQAASYDEALGRAVRLINDPFYAKDGVVRVFISGVGVFNEFDVHMASDGSLNLSKR